jgi:hypothetical protein
MSFTRTPINIQKLDFLSLIGVVQCSIVATFHHPGISPLKEPHFISLLSTSYHPNFRNSFVFSSSSGSKRQDLFRQPRGQWTPCEIHRILNIFLVWEMATPRIELDRIDRAWKRDTDCSLRRHKPSKILWQWRRSIYSDSFRENFGVTRVKNSKTVSNASDPKRQSKLHSDGKIENRNAELRAYRTTVQRRSYLLSRILLGELQRKLIAACRIERIHEYGRLFTFSQ